MTPYFQDEHVTIWHGDCLDLLPTIAPVDIVLTDPPYNVGIRYGDGTNDARGDYGAWCRAWFALCRERCKVMALTPGIVNVALWTAIEPPKWMMAWIKPAAMGRSPMGFCNWEPVLVYGKPQTNRGVDVVTAGIVPSGDVEGHPCPKPLKWATGIIGQLVNGGALLDPFAGSGTTLRAAKDMGMKAVGIEIEERYCEIAASRMAQGVLPLCTANAERHAPSGAR